jgi:hypothetical protein
VSGFEILTITFSFIVGLGVAQVLRSVAYVVRENRLIGLHWIPFSVAAIILFFHVQFWFGLAVINSIVGQWSWPIYGVTLLTAISIFLSGATVFPHSPTSLGGRGLLEDFETRGRISLLFLALYLVGWIGIGIMFWKPEFWQLVLVNGLFAIVAITIYAAPGARVRTILHMAMIAMTIYGAMTVWTTPNLEMPM